MEQFVTAVDFGETYFKLVKASITNDTLHICSTYKVLTRGLRDGEIYSKSEFQECLASLINKASTSKEPIHKIFVILPSNKLNVTRKKLELINEKYPEGLTTKEDIINLKKQMTTSGLKENEMSVGLYPISYYSDGRDLDKIEPYGERCHTYGLEAFVASLPISSSRGFIDSIEEMGIGVLGAIVAPIANSSLCLKQNEINTGAILLDLGGDGVSISAFYNGYILANYRCKKGITNVINILSNSLAIDFTTATEYLYKYGVGSSKDGGSYKIIEKDIKENEITEVIENGLNEVFDEIKKVINGFINESADLPIILTGGGANIYHIDNSISDILNRTTYTRGYSKVGGKDYSYNCCIGGIIYYLTHK